MKSDKPIKLGHQAPKGRRENVFTMIEIRGDLHYCISHNFLFFEDEEDKKLHYGLPCIYTDYRYQRSSLNFYGDCHLYWKRRKPISLESCIRRTLKCKNIPVGTIVHFRKDWYYPKSKFNSSFIFKVKKENKMDIKYEINYPIFFENFNTCEYSKELTDELRKNGFIVSVLNENPNTILGMIKTAATLKGQSVDDINDDDGGEIATAYGHGLRIGFSSGKNCYRGYTNGCENILYDRYDRFDKWSRCFGKILLTVS